jgi:cell wall-associated NlpC family hydrolase
LPADPAVAADPALAAEQGRGKRNRGGGGVSAMGQSVAGFAMQYEGYPYVAAGEGPYSFDCSGFTKFVVLNVTGLDISHDFETQMSMGTPVDRNSLQPGDVLFFQNTYRPGVSHAGIYIGGGQFIHAENESTGVRVSSLDDEYYASRWYGAVRYW